MAKTLAPSLRVQFLRNFETKRGYKIAQSMRMELNHVVGSSQENQTALESIGSGVKKVGERLAASMDRGSESLLSGAEALEGQALSAAVKLSDGAKKLREATSGDIVRDCSMLVSKYPFHAMIAGTVAGIMLGRSIWKRRAANQ